MMRSLPRTTRTRTPKREEEYEAIDPRTPLDQPDTYGAWIGTEVLDYLSRVTSWTEMVAEDEAGIDFDGTKPDEIMVAAAGVQAACDKLIDAVTRAEEQAATRAEQGELTPGRSAGPPAVTDSQTRQWSTPGRTSEDHEHISPWSIAFAMVMRMRPAGNTDLA